MKKKGGGWNTKNEGKTEKIIKSRQVAGTPISLSGADIRHQRDPNILLES